MTKTGERERERERGRDVCAGEKKPLRFEDAAAAAAAVVLAARARLRMGEEKMTGKLEEAEQDVRRATSVGSSIVPS